MISSIEGVLVSRDDSSVVIQVGGIGLQVFVPAPCLEKLGRAGEKVELFARLNVREDSLTLFGFSTESERSLFDSLTGVSGIGPKAALSILSCGESGEIARMIMEEDVRALIKVPGIGKKTAERIVVELKDRLEVERLSVSTTARRAAGMDGIMEEAAEALMSIGLSRPAAERALERIEDPEGLSSMAVEDIVRMALRKVPR